MHRPIFGHSFAVLVAPILLSVLAFNFLKKKEASVRGNAEDYDSDASGSSTTPIGTNSGGSSSTPTETTSSASSSSNAPSGNCYEVFLSFRGQDIRDGFTDHLYHGLVDAGIRTFRDNEDLCRGKKIGDDLFAAIKNSKILIPILSVNYGTSSWCLNELVQIMECKKNNEETIVLPIFYKVEPSDVRYQTGKFGDEFHNRERRLRRRRGFDSTILEKWKEALKEVSSLKGHNATGPEAELVKSVVGEVLSEVIARFELVTPEELVGIDIHVKNVMKIVANNSHATLFIGIHGMGGIGKTTLAKTIYNQLLNQFEYRSSIADIREKYKNGVEHLQNKLILDILKKENLVRDKDQGIMLLSSNFKDKKVLILLDDVDAKDHVENLAGSRDWFSSGSVIIITSRNKSILDNAEGHHNYELLEMDEVTSSILFSRHAFREDAPPCDFEVLTHDVVRTTGGLPLSLEVVGSFLRGKEPTVWKDTITQLRNVPDEKVLHTLKISYDALEKEQKKIFLDIACFFIDTDLRIASYMWDACGFYPNKGIAVLRLRSLIKVGENYELRMHDQLRDLGREIVRQEDEVEPRNRSRLWDSKEVREVMEVLEEDEGTTRIEAISLPKDGSIGFGRTTDQVDDILTGKRFKKLRNLRFLDARGAHFSGDFKNSIKKLKWLEWRFCPSVFEADNFDVEELRVLNLYESYISDQWRGWSFITMAKNLKYLDLSYCESLEKTSFLSAFKYLEVLILAYCWRIEQIDSSIGDMTSLVCLDLSWCHRLEGLPAEVGKLQALEQLSLCECPELSSLPDSIGTLQNLQILDVSWTGIKKLPDSIGALQNLEKLNINSTKIEELPNGIGGLRKLRELNASNCRQLGGKTPKSIGDLSSLQRLDLRGCEKLRSLSVLPSSLTYLRITRCRLPSLANLTHLKELRLHKCEFLECILEHPSTAPLEILHIQFCVGLKTLDVSLFTHLRTLSTKRCKKLLEIRGLDKLKYLESLNISRCSSIERLDLPESKGSSLPDGVGALENLEKLNISHTGIKELPNGIRRLRKLRELDASDCYELGGEMLESIRNLSSLQRLDLSVPSSSLITDWGVTCPSRSLPSLSNLTHLKELCLWSCEFIECIGEHPSTPLEKSLITPYALEILDIEQCELLKKLDVSLSTHLRRLSATRCTNLLEIRGLNKLKYLERLNISDCRSIERLDLPESKGLEELIAPDCKNLGEIQGLNRVESLEMIDISGCASIQRLDLPKSKGLKVLPCRSCEKLFEIQGLDGLQSLEEVDILGCASIQRLDLSKSKGLEKLSVGSCGNLFEIQGLDGLESLEVVFMCGFGRLPNICCFDTLRKLVINCCDNHHDIQGPVGFQSCTSSWIQDCNSLASFPNLSNFPNLEKLFLSNFHGLREIPGLEESTSLERIAILGCSSIEILPDFSPCTYLNFLLVRNCEKLTELQGLEELEHLMKLDISGCKSLKTIPELYGVRLYRNYEADAFKSWFDDSEW